MARDGQQKKKKKEQQSADASVLQNILYVTKALFHTYPHTVWATPLYMMCSVAMPLLTAFIPSVAIAAITEGDPKRFVFAMLGILLAYLVLGIVLNFSSFYVRHCRVYTRLGVFFLDYVKKCLTADYGNVEPAERQAELKKGAKAVVGNNYGTEKLMNESVEFSVQILGLVTFGAAVLTLDYRILLILAFMFVLDLVLRGHAIRYGDKHWGELSEVHRKQEYLEQGSLTLAAGKDVRVYGMQGWFHQISENLVETAVDCQKRIGLRWYWPSFGNQICVAAQEILTYFVLIGMVLAGEITVAEFTLQLGLVRGFSQWIYGVSVSFGSLKKANYEVNWFRLVMERPDRNVENAKPVRSLTTGPEIEFCDVCFRYPGAEADTLSHINFTMKAREKVALVGNNGAGKTTLVKLLCGLYQPTSGAILVNGEDISRYRPAEYQRLLSVLFQDVSPLSFTVEMNVAGTTPEQVDKKRVKEVLRSVGLWEKVEKLPQGMETYITQDLDEGGVQFSGGETQRLLLARAMYRNGPVLILDEPTSALDPIAESKLYEEYNAMTKEKTSLFISHRLASTKFCDRILLLDEGQIAETGTHEELMSAGGIYKELFDIQSHYYQEGEVTDDENKEGK
ncbi:MAG: ABC transporter ATP-binding protein [Lachnospiraceae bacterium]|nr:ABC transporter ATP-binding protein [Lachnospiraceae bacterium]